MEKWELTKKTLTYLLRRFNMSQKDLADRLGITYQALNMKINGHTDFTRSEIYEIMSIFGLNSEQVIFAFLTKKEVEDEGDSEDTQEQVQSNAC